MSTRPNERSNPTGLLFSFVGGATLSSNRALRALRAQQNPVRNIRTASGAKFRVYFSRPRWSGEISDKNFIFLFLGACRIRFAFATRRSASSLTSGWACEYSPKAKFRNPPTMYLDKEDANRKNRDFLGFFSLFTKNFSKECVLKGDLKTASSRSPSQLKNICGFYQDRFYSSMWIDFI